MKITLFTVFAIGLIFLTTPIARADSPQPFQYVLVKCSGLGTVTMVQLAEQQFDSQYGWDHALTTPAQWQASFTARVNEFASSLGCPTVLVSDNQLSLWYTIYIPTYQRILTVQ